MYCGWVIKTTTLKAKEEMSVLIINYVRGEEIKAVNAAWWVKHDWFAMIRFCTEICFSYYYLLSPSLSVGKLIKTYRWVLGLWLQISGLVKYCVKWLWSINSKEVRAGYCLHGVDVGAFRLNFIGLPLVATETCCRLCCRLPFHSFLIESFPFAFYLISCFNSFGVGIFVCLFLVTLPVA